MEKLLVLLFYIFIVVVESAEPDIVTLLIKAADKISKKRLDDAIYVRQSPEVDKIEYKFHKTTLFSSKNMEQKDQKVIVLGKKEDGLDDCGDKTAYVVLKLSDKTSSKYNVLYAYLRMKGKDNSTRTIEWENYVPRGSSSHNKAFIFGHERCSRSIFTSCKLNRPDKDFVNIRNLNIREKRDKKNDCVCDIVNSEPEAQLCGTILTSLNMAVTILAGADLIYKDEMKIQRDIVQQLMTQQRKQLGRSFSSKSNALLQNITESAAGQFIEDGKQSLARGVLMFYVLIGNIGRIGEILRHLEPKEGSEQMEEMRAEMRKLLGTKLLEGLFNGNFDVRANGTNPFPGLLMKVNIARQILYGSEVEEEDTEEQPQQKGRRLTKIAAKVVTVNQQRPLKASESMSAVLNKPKEKSAGQLFAQNAKAGFYVPYGLIETVGDVATSALGMGKTNNERTLLDQGIETVLDIGTKTVGSVVDVAANVLKPFGLGPLSKIVAGVGGAALGLAGGIASCAKLCEVMAAHQLLKVGAKFLGVGGLIGNVKKKKKPTPPPGLTQAQFAELYAQIEVVDSPPPMMVGVAAPQAVAVQPVGVAVQGGMAVDQGAPQGGMMLGQGAPQGGVDFGQGAPEGGMAMGVGMGQGDTQGGIGVGQGGLQGGIGVGQGGLQVGIGADQGASQLPVEMETELDLFTVWGWTSQYVTVQNLWMELQEPNVFLGFGTTYSQDPIQEDAFEKIVTYEDYIDYLILLFRIDNRKELRKQFVDLVNKKYISYDDKTKIFILLEKSSILTEENLTPDEEVYLLLSFELVSFSKAYKSMIDFLLLLQCPTGERLSKSVALIQLMTQEYLSLVFTYGDVHMVKLLRNYGYTLKTMYTKSLQDVYRYNTCKKCTPESISMVDNNAITLYGLMQWVLYGSWDYYVNSWVTGPPGPEKFVVPSVTNMYNAYFTVNRNDFITEVSVYIF